MSNIPAEGTEKGREIIEARIEKMKQRSKGPNPLRNPTGWRLDAANIGRPDPNPKEAA